MPDIFELIQQKCPNGVLRIVLNKVCDVFDGVHFTPEYVDDGIKFVSVENITDLGATEKRVPVSVYDACLAKPRTGDVFVTRIGVIGVCTVVENDEPLAYYVSLALLRPNQDVLDSRFLKYVIESDVGQAELMRRSLLTAVPIKINKNEIGKIKIPLPPLSVQREIVAILDKFDAYCNSMTAGLAGELEMRRKQYRYWAEELIMSGDIEMVSLGKLCSINKGQQINKADYEEGPYDVWNMGAEPSGTHVTYNRDVPTIVIAGHGNSVGTVNWVDKPFWAGGGCYYLDGFVPGLNDRYLFHAMKARERSLMGLASDGPIRHLYPRTIARAQVPVPVSVPGTGAWDAARQQAICDILDKLCELERELERELELRKKQYAYYRDMLLSFPEQKGA